MEERNRKIVLGLGNTLNRDEGLGVHALKALETELTALYSDEEIPVELLDGGTLGLNLLPLVEESSHLLILDATSAGKPPGTLIELKQDEIPIYRGIKMSDHQITFQEVLGLALFRDKFPKNLHLIGIQPYDTSIGIELSPTVTAIIPQVVERAILKLREWGLLE
jgi:hydrogenase maturation protease